MVFQVQTAVAASQALSQGLQTELLKTTDHSHKLGKLVGKLAGLKAEGPSMR